MKLKKIILTLSLISLPALAQEEGVTQLTPQGQAVMADMMKDYGTIAGGWYMQEKCKVLSPELLKEFEHNVAASTRGLNEVMDIDKKFLYQMQESARTTAYSDEWKCDHKGRYIVSKSVLLSRDLKAKLTQAAQMKLEMIDKVIEKRQKLAPQ